MLYGALLLVSAGIIAGVAARLLAHERTRLESAALQAEEGRLRNRAEELSLAVGVVQNEILRELRAIPYEEIDETLRNWERTNPLVRNVFVWRGPGDLLLPDPLLPLTREEEGFLTRYKTLFGGMHGWEERLDGGQADRSVSQQLFHNVSKGNVLAESSGWVPWYWENTLCMLGWVQRGERRCGVELEMAALLSELQRAMPLDLPEGRALAVLDAGGHRILQSGPLDPGDDARAVLSVPVGFMLPHWEVALYTADGRVGASAHQYAVASTLLVVVLFVCLFCAGGMLLLEAQRNRRDALQKTTFVSNVSHELKTPLTTIRMYTDLLRQGRVEDEEKKVRYLSTIASESERLTRLVNNVLDFGRLEQNRKKYQIGRFDLRDVVAETVQSQRLRIGEAGMALTEHFPSEPALVESDRDAVQQALLNLIDNAIKYAASGNQLLVELSRSGREFQIRVCDAGAGIPSAHRRKIFERFYRVDDSITARSQGSGLGLGLSRRMLTDLGGSLTYSPAPSGGACFTITLPGVEVV
ncbi:MAG: HAMP domain-containing histidine kinase [Lentisphaerae bacterium]|nr:HAMP domain-containing histidine kinase [Lentisphaerota bacterium]